VLPALVGVGAVDLNWTTGATGFVLLRAQLFTTGAVRASPYAPWILTFTFPVGAILALRRWKRSAARAARLDATELERPSAA
jgi:hypothetical protein